MLVHLFSWLAEREQMFSSERVQEGRQMKPVGLHLNLEDRKDL
jgi:hypothetical protein